MNYIEAIGEGFPNVNCHGVGDCNVYENIIWDDGDPLPSKAELDSYIQKNGAGKVDRKITVLAFRNRYTMQEKVMMDLLATDPPNATEQQRMMAASMRVTNADLATATFVDLDDESTQMGVQVLEYYGVLQPGRAQAILFDPIQEKERPR
jgi:hypothetical protein